MHRMMKKAAAVLLASVLWIPVGVFGAQAVGYYTENISNPSDSRITAVLELIEQQTDAQIREKMRYLIYDSDYAAISNQEWPYTNGSTTSWYTSIPEGGKTYSITGAKGCKAYANFVTTYVYGTDGAYGAETYLEQPAGGMTADALEAFVSVQLQAGEQLRVDYTHSLVFLAADSSGFYFMEYYGDSSPYIYLRYTTYENLAEKCNELNQRIFTYNVNPAENTIFWGDDSDGGSDHPPEPLLYYTETLQNAQDPRLETMLLLAQEQAGNAVAEDLRNLLYTSDYAAVFSREWPYPNDTEGWFTDIVDQGMHYSITGAAGGKAYANFVTAYIYGEDGALGAETYLEQPAGRMTAEGLQNFVRTQLQAGEHLRVNYTHSLAFVAADESGFYFMEYQDDNDPYIYLRYTTYQNLADKCNALNQQLFIYNVNPVINTVFWEDIGQQPEITGDVNGDGYLNNKDMARLKAYLADDLTPVNASGVDVNGDGWVNNKDVSRLKYLLAL